MKKLFNSIFVIIAAMVTFAGCAKEEIAAPETKTVKFFAESIETKTAFGTPDGTTYPTLWTENDTKVEISLNLTTSKTWDVVPSDDFKTATIDAKIDDDLSGSYVFYSVSPASANKSFSASYKTYNLEIPTTQTPSATSVDENAQILVAKSQTYSAFPDVVNFAYKHLTAYGRMSLANLNLNGAKISSVTLTASKNLAYRYFFSPETEGLEENGATKTITINTSSATDIWFACAPVDMSNATMDVVVNTDKGTFTKTVTFPEGRKFESGKIAKFAVNMSGVALVAPEVYELVTDPAVLTPDSKVIIVGGEYAMSTNQKSSNRGAAGVTILENTISSPSVDVQIFTVEEGLVSGTIAFNTGSGYIYAAASDGNKLLTKDTLDENGSWLVSISDGVTSVVAQGDKTRNVMQYNSSSTLFACYAADKPQQPVSIYKLKGSGTVLENYLKVSPATINVKADQQSATFTVSSDLDWTATPSAGATVTTDGNTVTVSFAANEVEEEKTYTVTVSADGVEAKTVTITQAKKILKTQLTVAEFIALKDGDDEYELTGTITGIYQAYDSGFNNISFYLTDETGTALIFRMSCDNADYTKVIVGNKITVKGKKTTYNESAQMAAGGQCISLTEVVTPVPTITFAENVVAITAVDDADIYFTVDGTEPTISDDDFYDEPYEIEESCTIKAIAVKEGLLQSAVVEKYCTYINEDNNEDNYSWHLETWASCEQSTSYDSNSIVGDLGTWLYTGCSSYDKSQYTTQKSLALGKAADNSSITSPTFSNGIQGIKFNYFANNTARKVIVTIYENGSVKQTITITPTAKNVLESAEINIQTTGATYFIFTPGSSDRRVSVGDIQVKY